MGTWTWPDCEVRGCDAPSEVIIELYVVGNRYVCRDHVEHLYDQYVERGVIVFDVRDMAPRTVRAPWERRP